MCAPISVALCKHAGTRLRYARLNQEDSDTGILCQTISEDRPASTSWEEKYISDILIFVANLTHLLLSQNHKWSRVAQPDRSILLPSQEDSEIEDKVGGVRNTWLLDQL